AYAVHSEIGDTTVGAKINGVERPLRTVLENGDKVEILRGSRPAAQPHWESLAVTGRARSAIRRLTRAAERGEFVAIGHRLIEHALRRIGLAPEEGDQPEMAERAGFEKVDALAEAIGRGRMVTSDMLEKAFPGVEDPGREAASKREKQAPSLIAGGEMTAGVTMHLAECCSPLPGDRIVGVLMPERGIEVHVIDCARLADYENQADRWLDLRWKPTDASRDVKAVGRIHVTTANRRGALALLAKTVSDAQGNIINVKTLKRSQDF